MVVGNQDTPGGISGALSSYAIQVRNLMDTLREQQEFITGLGLTGLEGLGFSPADAATVIADYDYLATLSGVYYGTATQPTQFNFDNALSSLWAGA